MLLDMGCYRRLEPRSLRGHCRHHACLRNLILSITTNGFVIPGSCPPETPIYPNPNLPQLAYNSSTSTGHPGPPITFIYKEYTNTETDTINLDLR